MRQLLIHFKLVPRASNLFHTTLLDIGDFEPLCKQKCMSSSHQNSYSCNTITCASKYIPQIIQVIY